VEKEEESVRLISHLIHHSFIHTLHEPDLAIHVHVPVHHQTQSIHPPSNTSHLYLTSPHISTSPHITHPILFPNISPYRNIIIKDLYNNNNNNNDTSSSKSFSIFIRPSSSSRLQFGSDSDYGYFGEWNDGRIGD
jgi:hypothetical protein